MNEDASRAQDAIIASRAVVRRARVGAPQGLLEQRPRCREAEIAVCGELI
jgi:hypothetical protein